MILGGKQRKKLTIHIKSTVLKSAPGESRKRRADEGEFSEEESSGGEETDDGEAEEDDANSNSMVAASEPEPTPPMEAPTSVLTPIENVDHFKKEAAFFPHPPKYIDIEKVHGY